MPASDALKYAEDALGVHEVYREAIEAHQRVEEAATEIAQLRDRKRDVEFDIQMREIELSQLESGKHPEMSATAMNTHMRKVVWTDVKYLELKHALDRLQGQLDGAEATLKISENTVRIESARMIELGGYFNYLAVVKAAAKPSKPTLSIQPTQPGENA